MAESFIDDDDDDNVSLTSTAASSVREYYDLECILAERANEDGEFEYLVKWEDYPLNRSTWESAESFLNDETIPDWIERKRLVAQGKEPAFNVAEFEESIEREDEARALRKTRRAEKRARIAALQSPRLQFEAQTTSDLPPLPATDIDLHGGEVLLNTTLDLSPQVSRADAPVRADGPPEAKKRKLFQSVGRESGKVSSNSGSVSTTKSTVPGRGPRRISGSILRPSSRPSLVGQDVMGNWNAAPRRKARGVGESRGQPALGENRQVFSKMSIVRRHEKFSRNERPPDPSHLQLFDPATAKRVVVNDLNSFVQSPVERRNPYEILQDTLAAQDKATTPPHRAEGIDQTLFVETPSQSSFTPPLQRSKSISDLASMNDHRVIDESRAEKEPKPAPTTEKESNTPIRRRLSTGHRNSPAALPGNKISRPIQDKSSARDIASSADESVRNSRELQKATSLPKPLAMTATDPRSTPLPGLFGLPFSRIEGDSGMYTGASQPRHDLQIPSPSDVYGDLVIDGVPHMVTYRGLPLSVRRLLLKMKRARQEIKITISERCTFERFRTAYHEPGLKYYGAGHIAPYTDLEKEVTLARTQLCQDGSQGGIFRAPNFSLLIWPTGDDAWKSCDGLFKNSPVPSSQLRFLLRAPLPLAPKETSSSTEAAASSKVLEKSGQPEAKSQDNKSARSPASAVPSRETSPRPPSSAINTPRSPFVDSPPLDSGPMTPLDDSQALNVAEADAVASFAKATPDSAIQLFKKYFRIDFRNLLLPGRKPGSDPGALFIDYPTEAADEYAVWTNFLQMVHAQFYTSRNPGDWKAFLKEPAGTVLLHASVSQLNGLPSLGKMLQKPSFNVWRVALRPSAPALSPMTLLFPKGAAVCLTDDTILERPDDIVRFLRWYEELVLVRKDPSTWKFVTRPRIREWILALINKHATMGSATESVYREIWIRLNSLVPIEDMDPADDFETPKAHAACASPFSLAGYDLDVGVEDRKDEAAALASNARLLTQWFGFWSRDRITVTRRFYVLDNSPPSVAIRDSATDTQVLTMSIDKFFEQQSIPKWELDQRRKAKQAQEAAKLAMADRARSPGKAKDTR